MKTIGRYFTFAVFFVLCFLAMSAVQEEIRPAFNLMVSTILGGFLTVLHYAIKDID